MSVVKLVAVFSEDKPGQMARITQAIAAAGVNIRWVAIATSESFGVAKFFVDKRDAACEALKQKGFTVSLIDVLAIEVADQPGGLHEVADCLARNGINMHNASGFVSNHRAVLLLEVKNAAQARAILEQQKLHLLTQEEALNW